MFKVSVVKFEQVNSHWNGPLNVENFTQSVFSSEWWDTTEGRSGNLNDKFSFTAFMDFSWLI